MSQSVSVRGNTRREFRARALRRREVFMLAGDRQRRSAASLMARPAILIPRNGTIPASVIPVHSEVSSSGSAGKTATLSASAGALMGNRAGVIYPERLRRLEMPAAQHGMARIIGPAERAGPGLQARSVRSAGISRPTLTLGAAGQMIVGRDASTGQLLHDVMRFPAASGVIPVKRLTTSRRLDPEFLPPFLIRGGPRHAVGEGGGVADGLWRGGDSARFGQAPEEEGQNLSILSRAFNDLSMRSRGAMIDEIATPQYPNMSIGLM